MGISIVFIGLILFIRPRQLFEQKPIQTEFTYQLANENFCASIKPHAIIFVISKSINHDSRSAIRRTWGNLERVTSVGKFAHLRIKLLFLIDIDESRLLSISLEQNLFHDIVQVRLPQHYTLSTYRDMAMLHWTETYCSEAMFTVKTDDDIFLNSYLLVNIINSMLVNMTSVSPTKLECNYEDPSALIYGIRIGRAIVIRNSQNSWPEATRYIVTDDEFPCKIYPPYLSGFGYIVNRNARSMLVCAFFRHQNIFHMSDVYITGILAEYLGIRRKHLGVLMQFRADSGCENFFKQNDPDTYACASELHHTNKDIDVFERFHTYWQRLNEKKFLYINRNFESLLRK